MVGAGHADKRGTARHAGAGRRTTWCGNCPPVKGIADCLGELRDLPGAGHVHHDLCVGEILIRAKIAGPRDRTPQFLRHSAVLVPVIETLGHRLQAVVDQCRIAIGIKHLRTHGNGRAGYAVAGTVPSHWNRNIQLFGNLIYRGGVVVPGRTFARKRNACLLKQRLVDVGSGNGQLCHEAIDGVPVRIQPLQEGAEICLPVAGVGKIGGHVEIIFRQTAKVGHTGQIRAFARGQLYRKTFYDGLVGNHVEHDGDVWVL